jgi:small conductance mechanosensitive channel
VLATTTAPSPLGWNLSADTAHLLTQLAIDWSGRIVAVLLLLIGAWLLGFYLRRGVGRLLDRTRIDKTVSRFLGNIVRWLVFLLGVVACLGFFGVNITSVAALVGAAGLTIGLAMQGSLTNLAAGIMLMLLRPFKIGDTVVLAGQVGQVDDLDLFNTKIDTPDNRRLIIPNGQVFAATIENTTHHADRRIDVPLRVVVSAEISAVRALLHATATGQPWRDPKRGVEVLVTNTAATGTDYVVRVWARTADQAVERDKLIEALKRALDAAGIALA